MRRGLHRELTVPYCDADAAWVFFSVSLLLPLGPLLAAVLYPQTAVVGLSLCGGVAALLGHIAMMCSLPFFSKNESDAQHRSPNDGKLHPPKLEKGKRSGSHVFGDHGWWSPFIAIQVRAIDRPPAVGLGLLRCLSRAPNRSRGVPLSLPRFNAPAVSTLRLS